MTSPPATRPAAQRWTTAVDGARLRHLRHRSGLSQEQLASQAGISLTTIRRLEHQPTAPCRCRTLTRLAAALDEDPASLIPATQP